MSRTLLFIDDDIDVREAFGDLLEYAGWTVSYASDGQAALEWLAANGAPSVILLDLKMPRVDGYEFRARQLADPKLAEVPTVIFTADVNPEGNGVALGHAPRVRKSASFDELAATLERAVATSAT